MSDEQEQDPGTRGILIAASIVFATLIILLDEVTPFTMLFTLDMIPKILRQKIETRSEGVLITATMIKRAPFAGSHTPHSNGVLGSMLLNKMRGDLHLGDTQENKKNERPAE